MLNKYAVYDENFNVLEIIRSNRRPNNHCFLNELGEDRPEVLEIVDEVYVLYRETYDENDDLILDENGDPILEIIPFLIETYDENGDLILDENGDPVLEQLDRTRKKLQINSATLVSANEERDAAKELHKMQKLRDIQKRLLLESDALYIETLTKGEDTTAVETYKQALRDWTETETDLDNPTPPTKPE